MVARNANEGFNVMVTAFFFMGHVGYAFYVARTHVSATSIWFILQCALLLMSLLLYPLLKKFSSFY